MITGLSHVTLAVRDLAVSLRFYSGLLGLRLMARGPATAHLSAGDLWLALVEDERARAGPLPEYTHLAFSVKADCFEALAARVLAGGASPWQENPTEGPSLYVLDPDGHKLELHLGGLEDRLDWIRRLGGDRWKVFD